MSQSKRLGSLAQFKNARRNILIATDVASRGLDIPSVDVVINYDLPASSKDYIHRVGRTARAGRSGKAVAMVTQYDVEVYQRIEKAIAKKLDPFPGSEAEVLLLLERVSEASRIAQMEMREVEANKRGRKHFDGLAEDEEEEEGGYGKGRGNGVGTRWNEGRGGSGRGGGKGSGSGKNYRHGQTKGPRLRG